MDVQFNLTGLQILQFVIAIFLPLLVGLVTTKVTSSGLKAVLLLALSAISAVLTGLANAAQQNVSFDLGTALIAALGTFIIGVAVQFGFWKPTGATAAVQDTLITAKPTNPPPPPGGNGGTTVDLS